MKVILSRKGFDSANGGIASPILPDGTLLSLPIPGSNKDRVYSEARYNDHRTYEDIIKQLKPTFDKPFGGHDPDIRQSVYVNPPVDWKPAFGQCGSSQTHLHKQGIGKDDLFLFFGWFRQTEENNGKLRYIPKSPDIHIIFGYLQIGDMITEQIDIRRDYSWHPHANLNIANNCLYIPRDKLSWNDKIPGYGVFSYDKRLVLTKDSMTRSSWKLPDFFKKINITGQYKNPWRTDPQHGEYFRVMDIGQEFVIEENDEVTAWAKSLIEG